MVHFKILKILKTFVELLRSISVAWKISTKSHYNSRFLFSMKRLLKPTKNYIECQSFSRTKKKNLSQWLGYFAWKQEFLATDPTEA